MHNALSHDPRKAGGPRRGLENTLRRRGPLDRVSLHPCGVCIHVSMEVVFYISSHILFRQNDRSDKLVSQQVKW